MSQSELEYIIEGNDEKEITNWEQTRTLCFYIVIAGTGSRKIKKPSDLFKFPWDKKTPKTSMTKEEIDKLRDKINALKDG